MLQEGRQRAEKLGKQLPKQLPKGLDRHSPSEPGQPGQPHLDPAQLQQRLNQVSLVQMAHKLPSSQPGGLAEQQDSKQ